MYRKRVDHIYYGVRTLLMNSLQLVLLFWILCTFAWWTVEMLFSKTIPLLYRSNWDKWFYHSGQWVRCSFTKSTMMYCEQAVRLRSANSYIRMLRRRDTFTCQFSSKSSASLTFVLKDKHWNRVHWWVHMWNELVFVGKVDYTKSHDVKGCQEAWRTIALVRVMHYLTVNIS